MTPTGRTPYRKWTDEQLAQSAKGFQTRGEFLAGDPSAYLTAKRRKIFEKIVAHMKPARTRWTEKAVRAEAKKYNTRGDFHKHSRAAYSAACKLKILADATSHMPSYAGKGKTRGPNIITLRKQVAQ